MNFNVIAALLQHDGSIRCKFIITIHTNAFISTFILVKSHFHTTLMSIELFAPNVEK